MNSLGKLFWRSETNCSATHSDTSHPVTNISTVPPWHLIVPSTWAFILARMQLARFHAVMRFSPTSCQSSWICLQILGMSWISAKTGSAHSFSNGLINSLFSSRVSLFDNGLNFLWLCCKSTTLTRLFIIFSTNKCLLGGEMAASASSAKPQSSRQISPPRSSKSSRTALSASLLSPSAMLPLGFS